MYTVKILGEEEFEKLPYKKVKTSLGLADPSTNTAYIRDTGYNDVTKATIAHELDELVAKVSPHEEDGIRYKDLGGFASAIGQGAKSIAQPVFSAAKNVASLPFKAAGGLARGVGNALKPSNLNAAGGAFGKALGAAKDFGGNVLDTFRGGGGGGQTPSTGGLDVFGPLSGSGAADKGINDIVGGFPAATRSTGPAPGTGSAGILDIFKGQAGDLAKNVAGPLAISSLGNLFAPKIETPDFSGVSNRLEQQITEGGDPELRGIAKNALKEGILGDPSQVPEGAFLRADQVADDVLDRDIDALKQQFKAANPSTNIENNSAFLEAQNEVRERDRERRIGLRQQVEFEFMREELGRRQEDIRLALNLDQSQMQQLVNLAQLEVGQIMIETGIAQGEAEQIKQLFGDFGQVLLQQNLGA